MRGSRAVVDLTKEKVVSDAAFRELLDLLMCSDQVQCSVSALTSFTNDEARSRGYIDWIDAYHGF